MMDPRWRYGRAALRRCLVALLPDDDWSQEFLGELDDELALRARSRHGPGLTIWYVRQLFSRATLGFVWAVRARQRGRRMMGDMGIVGGLLLDLRQAWRGMARDRWATLTVIATLAVGIGSVSAMFGLGERLFLSGPPHVAEAAELQRVFLAFEDVGGRRTSPWIPYSTASAIRDGVEAFDGATIYRGFEELAALGPGARPVTAVEVDGSYFGVMGAVPVEGRFFGEDGPADAVVLSEPVAREEFGSPAAALGRTVRVGSFTGTVVGVAPTGFAGPDLARIDLWVPLDRELMRYRNWWLVGRLARGRSPAAALAEAASVHEAVDPGPSSQWAREGSVALADVTDDLAGERSAETSIAVLLLVVVGLVLVISWANVLNLLLARVTRRRSEVVVRIALGVGRWRLARMLLSESVILSLLAGLASLPLAYAEGVLVRDVLLPGVAWRGPVLGPELVTATFFAVVASGLLLGVWPARFAYRTDVAGGLSQVRPGSGGGRTRAHTALAAGQVTLSAALLLCAGLFVKSFWTLRVTDLGVAATEVHAVTLRSFDFQTGAGDEIEDAIYAQAYESMRQRDDIGRVALAVGLPFFGNVGISVHLDGRDSVPALPGGGPFLSAVSGGYFAAMGTRIVRGDPISDADVATGAKVAVVGEATARALWPAGDAIGACVRIGAPTDPCYRVVGIAADVHRVGYREARSLQLYFPLGSSDALSGATLIVRSDGLMGVSESDLAAVVQRTVQGIDYVDVRRLDTFLDAQIRPWRLGAVMLSLVSVLAMVIAVAGVFSVLSYLVAQRRREIGVRMALGASRDTIHGQILKMALGSGLVGVATGYLAVLAGSRWLAPLLFETPVTDPVVMPAVAVGLLAAAAVAGLIPAAQASRVDPVTSLRADG